VFTAAAATGPAAVAAPSVSLPVIAPSRVAIAIEHGLEQGLLRVFIDDVRTLETALAGRRTKRLLVFNKRSGAAAEIVDVPPGDHVLRFEVEGGGVVRRGLVRSLFESDRTRLLRVKVEGRTLDLDWRS
jgi:hypothetical protein